MAATHGVLLEGARAKLTGEAMADLLVTDTIEHLEADWPRRRVVSVAPLIADAVHGVTLNRVVGGRR